MEAQGVARFEAKRLEPGESVLASVEAEQNGCPGVAILTERRMCFYATDPSRAHLDSISVQHAELRYLPERSISGTAARFETPKGSLSFRVPEETSAAFRNFLGNLKELRDAQDVLLEAGYVPPPAKLSHDVPSAEYRLMRLRELVNQGLLSEGEYLAQRGAMVARMCQEG